MRTLVTLAFVVAAAVPAQTTGVPGVNDFTINGQGSGATSPYPVSFLDTQGFYDFACTGTPGRVIIGVVGPIATNALVLKPGSTLDLSPATVVLDGYQSLPGFPLSSFLTIPPTGAWSLGITVTIGVSFNMQLVLFDPVDPCPFLTTQAIECTAIPTGPIPDLCPGGTPITLPANPDDGAVCHAFADPGGFTFYGVNYTDVFINMNGELSFGGDTLGDFSPSSAEFVGGPPRVSPAWDDWQPNVQGTIKVLDGGAGGTLCVEWHDVVHWSIGTCVLGQDTNTFAVTLDTATGDLSFEYGPMILCSTSAFGAPITNTLTGISSGGDLSGMGVTPVDLSATGGNVAAAPLDALFEDFSLAPFDLSAYWAGPSQLLFFANPGLGTGPYVQMNL